MANASAAARRYADRADAAAALAAELRHRTVVPEDHGETREPGEPETTAPHARRPALVLGLARGGVPIAAGIGQHFGLPWDAMIVRKLGVPDRPEVAFGALAAHGSLRAAYYSPAIMADIAQHTPRSALRRVEEQEAAELERRQQEYLGGRVADVRGRVVIVADDGLATGATMRAALDVLRQGGARRLIVGVPVGPPDTCAALTTAVDLLVCPYRPAEFQAVGSAYRRFDQVSDAEVHRALNRSDRTRREFDS